MTIRRMAHARAPASGDLRACVLGTLCALWTFSALPAAAATPETTAAPAVSAPNAAPAPEPTQAGVLKSVQGDVRLQRADGRTQAAQSGDGVSQVDRLLTGANSGASLRLRDGTVLVIGPQSQLDLKQYQFNATTHDGNILLSLLQGSMRMVSGLIAKKQPEAVRIDTQTATIGIRGTDFIVSTDAHP